MDIKIKKKWTLDRVRKKLQKAGLSEAGAKISDATFEELLILTTAFKNTVTIGFTPDEDGEPVAAKLGFSYGKVHAAAEAAWYPINPTRNQREYDAMKAFAELIGGIPVYWRVVETGERGT